MAMNFEELDDTTRRYMLSEFEAEIGSGNPYLSKALSARNSTPWRGRSARRPAAQRRAVGRPHPAMHQSYSWNSIRRRVQSRHAILWSLDYEHVEDL